MAEVRTISPVLEHQPGRGTISVYPVEKKECDRLLQLFLDNDLLPARCIYKTRTFEVDAQHPDKAKKIIAFLTRVLKPKNIYVIKYHDTNGRGRAWILA